jgi:Domain of unknown function (DUF4221)
MKSWFNFYVFIFLSGLQSCQSSPDKEKVEIDLKVVHLDSCTLQLGAKKVLLLDTTTSDKGYLHFFREESGSHLLMVNSEKNTIHLYDWNIGKLVKSIPLEREGPNGVGNIQGAVATTSDSIYVLSPDQFRVSLINTEGKVLRKYSILPSGVAAGKGAPTSTKDIFVGQPICEASKPMIKVGNEIYMSAGPRMFWNDPTFFERSRLLIRLNLTTGGFEYLMPFPDVYRQPRKYYPPAFSAPSHAFNGKAIIASFPADVFLYEVSGQQDKWSRHAAPSMHFNEVVSSLRPLETSSNETAEMEINNEYYERIMYNPFQHVYYRMTWLPDKKVAFSAINPSTDFMVDFSLIILDKHFRKIGEYMLPREINSTHFLNTPDGIYGIVSSKNEDELIFQQLKLVAK